MEKDYALVRKELPMWGRKEDSVEQPRSELPPRTQGVGEVANTPPARPSVAVPKAARTGSSIGRTVKLKRIFWVMKICGSMASWKKDRASKE